MTKRPQRLLDAQRLWDFALKSLGMRALTVSEMRDKLHRRAEDPADVDGVLAKLKEYGYLNDDRFAETYSTARRDNQGFGKRRVLQDLRQRKVAPKIAEQAVGQTFDGVDETVMIEQFLARKYRGKALPVFLQERKNLASAFRRLQYAGFGAAAAIQVLKRYAAQAEELEAEETAPDLEG
jgi:regulatory protein